MKEKILSTESPSEFIDLLLKYCKRLSKKADYNFYINELTEILENNKIKIHNGFVIAQMVEAFEPERFDSFQSDRLETIFKNRYYNGHESEKYWLVKLLPKIIGKKAYDFLIAVIRSDVKLDVRANAMKQLAIISGQPFDKDLPVDPGYWQETDLRLDEMQQWIKDGCKEGDGYLPPNRDRSLFEPTNEFEAAVSKLNRKLQKDQNHRDYSNYNNFLIVADENKLGKVSQKYDIKGRYLEFLKRYSPCNVIIQKGIYDIFLYGVDDILKNQIGYSIDENGDLLKGFPENYLVIADRCADPYCIDLEKEDSEIYFARHGEGQWKFKKAYNSFVEFLEYLSR